jgi:hypothetical protein
VGFNGFDAEFGTSLAKRLLSGYLLSDKQKVAGRKMIIKYLGQLLKIANKELSSQQG